MIEIEEKGHRIDIVERGQKTGIEEIGQCHGTEIDIGEIGLGHTPEIEKWRRHKGKVPVN